MLVVFVALVALVNGVLGMLPALGGAPLSLERLLGYAFAPLAWACGVPWSEVAVAGQLLGKKTVLNELLAYLDLAALPDAALSPRSRVLMTYALCGFANFGSLGIMLGGMGRCCRGAPGRALGARHEVDRRRSAVDVRHRGARRDLQLTAGRRTTPKSSSA